VRAYPELGGILWNSSCGASHKFWSHDGRELFFSDGERLFALPIVSESPFRAGTPAMLFEGEYTRIVQAPNGRFLALKDVKGTGARELVVVFNWFDEFEDLVPGGR
jgi:hypothetical protein